MIINALNALNPADHNQQELQKLINILQRDLILT